jgi:hypothetical protein
MKTVVYGQLHDVDRYFKKRFTKANTDKQWIAQQSKLLNIPQDEVLDALNSLQDKGILTRLTKNKIKLIGITI